MKVWELMKSLASMPAGKDIVIVYPDSEISLDIIRVDDNEPGENDCSVIIVTRNSAE
jgi:hypothetical protein